MNVGVETATQNNRRAWTATWTIISVVVGWAFGLVFGLTGRELLFPSALFGGGYLIWTISVIRRIGNNNWAGDTRRLELPAAVSEAVINENGTDEVGALDILMNQAGTMSPEEARKWLDEFLAKQQR